MHCSERDCRTVVADLRIKDDQQHKTLYVQSGNAKIRDMKLRGRQLDLLDSLVLSCVLISNSFQVLYLIIKSCMDLVCLSVFLSETFVTNTVSDGK